YIFSLFGVEADDLLISEFVQTIFPIFAAITRSLDTAEGRVRLHCSRASVDGNSAGPDFLCHAIGLSSIRRINCSGQAKIAGVGQCYGFIIVVKTNDRTDGAEYFFLRQTAAILHIIKQGRFKEKAFVETFWPLAAGNQCRTFILCDSNIFLGPFACDFADQRTIVNCGIRWIANLEMGEHRLHRRNKLWADTVMHDMARGERTALPTMRSEEHTSELQ